MIAFVRAYSLEAATEILRHREPLRCRDLLEYHGRVAWIGFEPSGPSPLRGFVAPDPLCTRWLLLTLTDCDPAHAVAYIGERESPPLLSIDHARQIVAFVRELAQVPEEWALAVHCTAGIGRSGSVSRWVQDVYAPVPEWRWAAMHTRCHPREWFLRLLFEAHEEATL